MADRPRKRSASITLVLIGAAALAGCSQDSPPGSARAMYATKDDCLRDWRDPAECEEVVERDQSGATRRSYYVGPSRSSSSTSRSWGSSSSSHSSGTVSRGGFGSSGHSHSSAS